MSKTVKTTPAKSRSARWPCIFRGRFVREQVDPRVKAEWEAVTGKPAPFGRLRMNFQQQHCRTLNPYGSDGCPYQEEECALAFLGTVQATLLPWIDDPAAYFVKVAKSTGIERADNKPLARERHREEGPGHPGRGRGGHGAGQGGGLARVSGVHPARDAETGVLDEEDLVRRSHARPVAIGDLLGAYNPRPREGSAHDGQEGSE